MSLLKISISLVVIFFLCCFAIFAEDEGAIYDYKTVKCTISDNKAVIEADIKLTVLNGKGRKYGTLIFSEGRYAKLKNVSYNLIDASGKIIKSGKKGDFEKHCGFGGSGTIYDEDCVFSKELELTKFPYTIEYSYKKELKSLFFWGYFRFQYNIPVISASYELITPADFKFQYRNTGIQIEPKVDSTSNKMCYLWKLLAIPELEKKKRSPDGYPDYTSLRFIPENFRFIGTEFSDLNWSGIGAWYHSLREDCILPPDYEPIPHFNDTLALIDSIFNCTVDQIRYVMVSIGESGWKPDKGKYTLEQKYGDCKAMSNILTSRLNNCGIEAYPVLILTRGVGKIYEDFPTFRFNHIFTVAIVGSDTLWLDPTCDMCTLDDLRSDDEYLPALIVTDTGGVLVKTPASLPEDNRFAKEIDAYINADLSLEFKTRLLYTGNYSQSMRRRINKASADELNSIMYDKLPGGRSKFVINEQNIMNLDDKKQPLIIELDCTKKKKVDLIGKKIYFNPFIFGIMEDLEKLDIDEREVPISIGYPYLKENITHLTWSESLAVDSVILPENFTTENSFGKARIEYFMDSNAVRVNIQKSYNSYIIPVEQFEELLKQRCAIKKATRANIKLILNR